MMSGKYFSLAAGLLLITAGVAFSVPIIDQHWSVADPTIWSVKVVDGSLPASPPSPVATITPSGTSVTLDFRAATLNPADSPWAPTVAFSTTSKSGDWSTLNYGGVLSVNFSLNNVNDVTPVTEGLSLYYVTSGGTTNLASALTAPAVTSSQSYSIPMLASYWLYDPSSLMNISEFGFMISEGPGTGARQYVFNDVFVSVAVPEPETVWMILAVLASLGITFRMRLLELGKQAIARIKA